MICRFHGTHSDHTALPLQEEKALDLTVRSRDHRRPSSKARLEDPKPSQIGMEKMVYPLQFMSPSWFTLW